MTQHFRGAKCPHIEDIKMHESNNSRRLELHDVEASSSIGKVKSHEAILCLQGFEVDLALKMISQAPK